MFFVINKFPENFLLKKSQLSTTFLGNACPDRILTKCSNVDSIFFLQYYFLLISSQEDSTQYSDGVPFVTQCPILPGQEFKWYNFNAEPSGTFWFHSHNPFQRDDGAYGTLVIRDHPGI